MGDLIQKLPTDEVQLSREEKQNFKLLFGEEEPNQSPPAPIRVSTPLPEHPNRPLPVPTALSSPTPSTSPFLLKKELCQIGLLVILFFIFQFSFVNNIFQNYVPFCKSSELIRNAIKALVLAIVMWVLINFKYLKQG